ncbi:hypothetical protein BDZ91DRAFT_535791 [Kalaharituber pfeilii]|nr:hypothetical protein BDZ91DRAFT_535791 [Kalaharituber pfeilii]
MRKHIENMCLHTPLLLDNFNIYIILKFYKFIKFIYTTNVPLSPPDLVTNALRYSSVKAPHPAITSKHRIQCPHPQGRRTSRPTNDQPVPPGPFLPTLTQLPLHPLPPVCHPHTSTRRDRMVRVFACIVIPAQAGRPQDMQSPTRQASSGPDTYLR